MNTHLMGDLLGRLAITYAIVWSSIWLMLARCNWRDTFRLTNHWSGLVAITTMFLIGLIVAQASEGSR